MRLFVVIFILFATLSTSTLAMQIPRPWTTKHWCESVVQPEWPFTYSKYSKQVEEIKGRVSTNLQDVRHECDTRGVRSKCHICEDIVCGQNRSNNQTCHFQLQGVSTDDMSINIPTVSDVPWAVNGTHRYDFGGASTTHVCMYLSGSPPCQSNFGQDYSNCELRCWGHGEYMSGENSTAEYATKMIGEDRDEIWPNHKVDNLIGASSTPWELPLPTMAWNYPKYLTGNDIPINPNSNKGKRYSFNPQGFVFTMAGSRNAAGFVDGGGSDARFRYPEGVAVDHEGYVYVADTGNHAIRMISPRGNVRTLAGTGSPGSKDGYAADGTQFSSPTDLALWRDWAWRPYPNPIDPDSFLYSNGNGSVVLFVADTGNHRIRKITGDVSYDSNSGEKILSNISVSCFAGRCEKNPEPGFADGKKSDARFNTPLGISVSDEGDVFVADTNNHRVRMINQFGTVRTVAGASGRWLNFPSDVAYIRGENAIMVTDRHRIHRVNLIDGTVTKLAGGANEGDSDGDGYESTLNSPSSLAITGDGVAYVADSASCRIRTLSDMSTVALQVTCSDTLASIMRPKGCSSYNHPIDKYGLAATSIEGNIQYNYRFRNQSDAVLGKDFIGRSLKNCVGSPPISQLDKRRWNDTISSYPFNYNLVVDDNKTRIREDPNDGTKISVRCSAECPDEFIESSSIALQDIYSTKFYRENTSICGAAVNAGLFDISDHNRIVDVTVFSHHDSSDTRQLFSVTKTSRDMRLETIAGAPASLRGKTCGHSDSFPPQSSMFYHPSGLGAYVNRSLDDAFFMLYIADRDNHVIRGMTATCSFRCENNGRCIGPNKCDCLPGWSGIDCTKPVCENSCAQREVCVAPNTCDCIPGFRGVGCIEAKCVQKCINGQCSSPDTCTCDPGWFDSNCTTPVCEQTCGNGGNCTGPNTCTCPQAFTFSEDCRTPACDQQCLNGGLCVAPNTCQCPPGYSGYDCSMPVCHQGSFVSHENLPDWMIDPTTKLNKNTFDQCAGSNKHHWLQYQPCNLIDWCNVTGGFDCSQKDRRSSPATPNFGSNWRYATGRKEHTETCMMLELHISALTHFQYLSAMDNSSTSHFRYSPNLPYNWYSKERLPWNAFDAPADGLTQPYKYQLDRQIALAEYVNVTQGAYMCANGGKCVSPDVCSCAEGWIGFDCRVPICKQGYYEPTLETFVEGIKSDKDFITFEPFLDPKRPYDLDSSRNFSSNRDRPVWVERFIDETNVQRSGVVVNGSRYLIGNESQWQGGYECSIRSVTKWEDYRSGFILDHPNYYSRYMNEKVEDDGYIYSHWKGMNFPPTHRKTEKLVRHNDEFIPQQQSFLKRFVYTNVGYMKDGVWVATGAKWIKGNCVVEFERKCNDDVIGAPRVLVQDTDESYRPSITYDDKRALITGRWFASDDEVCVDRVVRGCFNNGTCIAPNTCECSFGWSGTDCSIPVCKQTCLHNGNCTHPNTCTCERGWSGDDCSIPLCAQDCLHGECVAPDTCKCDQWENQWRDGRVGGGVPLFQKPDGNPQMTGYTGYDCSTPICVQAETFRLNVNATSNSSLIVPLGGHGKDGTLECEKERCPEFDAMVTQNDGRSFQDGCGWDVLETGCCFEVNVGGVAYSCLRCTKLSVLANTATCSKGALKEWKFNSAAAVPLAFRTNGDIRKCGPLLNSRVVRNANQSKAVSTTSNLFLCHVRQWKQGDFIDTAGLQSEPGIGADFGLASGRHIRVNYNNYQRSDSEWIKGPEIPGEGIFECWNQGSCIAPDVCSCKDGYGGFDCSSPLCRHTQISGKVVGCMNGVCMAKDTCQCTQRLSVLSEVHPEAERGLTGWSGTDCSMPMCIQGSFDPFCNVSEAQGNEGCYRCTNGGICVRPDLCKCAEGWTGYDCRTPVCKAELNALVRTQLMTSDIKKLRIFENDPCGMAGFDTLRDRGPRGVCSQPNQCACLCKGSYDKELCKKEGGKHCQTPFHDPLFRYRDVIAQNEVFGTRNCNSGYEGLVDEYDMFSSCHLKIYEPSFFVRYTVWIVILSVLTVIILVPILMYLGIQLMKQQRSRRRQRQQSKPELTFKETKVSAFRYRQKVQHSNILRQVAPAKQE